MAHDADKTRRKLLDAATNEFAAHGIAGARVERIVSAAEVNSALLYRYFGSKLKLFEAVLTRLTDEVAGAVPIASEDLPAYAGALFDFHQDHPQVVRLAAWYHLERAADSLPTYVDGIWDDTISKVGSAQDKGLTTRAIPAAELAVLVVHMSLVGSDGSTVFDPGTSREVRRRALVAAVRTITEM
ncbi:TetR family transcriptional regulator [Streptomyces sp. SID1121]|uniref:TetR family transcriptional regulator n=1 Tax=Streptomyces sp. SID1121 TaxID=3425888 RepID=UPI00405632E8